MCGRFTLTSISEKEAALLGIRPPLDLIANYNIAPSQTARVIIAVDSANHREMKEMEWGLLPFWAKSPSDANRPINARSETAAEKPSFREAIQKRRCIIPADGYFEWARSTKVKQPYYFQSSESRLFALGGIWEKWSGPDEEIISFAIITTEPNCIASKVHDRMPLIIRPETYDLWLDTNIKDPNQLKEVFTPYPDELLTCRPVTTHVNNPANNDPDCIATMDTLL